MRAKFRYATVFSGIEAPSVAWKNLGWETAFFSEIEPFACRVLAHHYPKVPNLGDVNKINCRKEFQENVGRINLLIGGSPCQSFSVAGKQSGLSDQNGQLSLQFGRIVESLKPEWFIWENVPGVLRSSSGEDFTKILGPLAESGYGVAYRILDARFFGVPQRRRRVFAVGHRGDWKGPYEVLFEPESGGGNSAEIGEEREETAAALGEGATSGRPVTAFGGGNTAGPIGVATCLTHHGVRLDFDSETFIVDTGGIRRLTPLEYERLQGFPDNYTLLKSGSPDGPRYKAIGNSMAVPVIRWLGQRIAMQRW